MKCCVVIPIYQETPNSFTISSVAQTLDVCKSDLDIYFICANEFSISNYEERFEGVKVMRFGDHYFSNIEGYNRLMLTVDFYYKFSDYDYMLICQSDAWLFKNEIISWCNKGYDYIGAPWIDWEWSTYYAQHLTFPRRLLCRLGFSKFNLVGNGGFSLRKIKSCIANLKLFSKAASSFRHNEDYFFSFYIKSFNPFFRIPKEKEALSFSFDVNPDKAFELNNQCLPMGCHAWEKNYDFWKKYIKV